MTTKSDWKHGAWFSVDSPDAVAVFDDEPNEDGTNTCDSIYYKKGNRFSPCRSVNREMKEHWTSVLLAWACTAPLLDMRNNREVPLP